MKSENHFEILDDHPLFPYISDLYDNFCSKEARKRKKEMCNDELNPEERHSIVNTVIIDFVDKVRIFIHSIIVYESYIEYLCSKNYTRLSKISLVHTGFVPK